MGPGHDGGDPDSEGITTSNIASMLLTTECVISDEKEEKDAGHRHGGMRHRPDRSGGGGMDMM